jgi:type I restriction enzyme S subunit
MSSKATLASLCALVVDCPHATPKWTESGVVVLRNQNIKNGRLDLGSPSFTDEEHYRRRVKRAVPQGGDIVITREAPMGDVCQIPVGLRCCLGQRQVLLRPDLQKIDGRFLLFALQSAQVQDQIAWNQGTGSTVSNLRIPVLEALKIPVPTLKQQYQVANLLGAIDDRITLLRETNATLEAIAEALFKSWFIDFDPVHAKMEGRIPEGMDEAVAALFPDGFEASELGLVPKGWRSGQLGEVARTVRKQLQPSELHAGLHYVGLEHMPRKSLSLVDWATAEKLESAKAVFREGDVLFGKLRPYFHKVVIAPFDGVCSTDVLVCQAVKPTFMGFVAMQLFSEALVGYAERLSNGAKMPRVNWSDLADYSVILPTEDLAAGFTETVMPLFSQMKRSTQTARTLATLRDTLLPRLISGQLRLPENTDALVEEVFASSL